MTESELDQQILDGILLACGWRKLAPGERKRDDEEYLFPDMDPDYVDPDADTE